MSHRLFSLLLCLALGPTSSALQAQTGIPVPALSPLDQAMDAYLRSSGTAGGSLAVARAGRLVYARGFGQADRNSSSPVQPDSLFRIGSVSKPLTAMTALRLVQDGRLSLDAPILPILGPAIIPEGGLADGRWQQITVRHLLQHSGGWDAAESFDPLLSTVVPESLGLTLPLRQPVSVDQVIRFMAGQPLQFTPGTRYAYSNFGMMLLGRILERVSGRTYERLVQETVLEPMGVRRMALGGGTPSVRRLGEVEYYDPLELPAVYPGIGDRVPAPDGGFYFEIIQGAGAWVASAVDLARFSEGLTGRTGEALLRPDLLRQIATRPGFGPPTGPFYGLGWQIDPAAGAWFHDGFLEGTYAFLYRTEGVNGFTFALTLNGSPEPAALAQLMEQIVTVLRGLREWPAADEFSTYLPLTSPRVAGVVNAASHSAGFSAGSLVTLYGSNLGPVFPASARIDANGRVTTVLAGIEVFFDGLAAPLLAVSRDQITAVVPQALRGRREVRIEVQRQGIRSAAFQTALGPTAPGLFTNSGNGRGLVLAVEDGRSANSEQQPARRGSVVTVWATGLDETRLPVLDGEVPRQANPLQRLPRLTINGEAAEILYAGVAPGSVAGTIQLNFRVPESATSGRAFLQLETPDGRSRTNVWLWIQ